MQPNEVKTANDKVILVKWQLFEASNDGRNLENEKSTSSFIRVFEKFQRQRYTRRDLNDSKRSESMDTFVPKENLEEIKKSNDDEGIFAQVRPYQDNQVNEILDPLSMQMLLQELRNERHLDRFGANGFRNGGNNNQQSSVGFSSMWVHSSLATVYLKCVFLLACVLFFNFGYTLVFMESLDDRVSYRLPNTLAPELYELTIVPSFQNDQFFGQVKILINPKISTDVITLNAFRLNIIFNASEIWENGSLKKLKIKKQTYHEVKQMFTIKTERKLKDGLKYTIRLKYVSRDEFSSFQKMFYRKIDENLDGERVLSTRFIAATQFQPIGARTVFPCFDEPSFKSKYQLNIARPFNMASYSSIGEKKSGSTYLYHFDDLVFDHYDLSASATSTNMLHFVVANFRENKAQSQTRNLTIFTRDEKFSKVKEALDIGLKTINFYEEFFQIEFPLTRYEIIAMPDFIDSCGPFICGESDLLDDNEYKESRMKPYVMSSVISQQFFGHHLTLKWWNDLWIIKGLIGYFSQIAAAKVSSNAEFSETQLFFDNQKALLQDSYADAKPLYGNVSSPGEIKDFFQFLSHQKSSAIIRMLNYILTPEYFKKCMIYLMNFGKSIDENELCEIIDKNADSEKLSINYVDYSNDKIRDRKMNVSQIVNSWTKQPGYPLVTVVRNYANNTVTIKQERFGLNFKDNQTWWIPLTFTFQSHPNFNDTKSIFWLKDKAASVTHINGSINEWLIFNVQQTGFYRVNYDISNWNMIIKTLKSSEFQKIQTANRAQLIDDSLNLAKFGYLDYDVPLRLLGYLERENEELPWEVAMNGLNELNEMVYDFDEHKNFEKFVRKISRQAYKNLNVDSYVRGKRTPGKNAPYSLLIKWSCKFNLKKCIRKSKRQFAMWRKMSNNIKSSKNPIKMHLREVFYCTAVKFGDSQDWHFLLRQFNGMKSDVFERKKLLTGLSCTRNVKLLTKLLDWSISKSDFTKEEVFEIFKSVSENSVIGRREVFKYVLAHSSRIAEKFPSNLTVKIIKLILQKICVLEEHDAIQRIFFAYEDQLTDFQRLLMHSYEEAKFCKVWKSERAPEFKMWLTENVP